MKSAVPVHKVLRLPRALQLKVLKVLRLPRALQLKVLKVLRTKCRFCHETCYWRCSKCCACHEICTFNAQSAAPATKPSTGGAQSAAPATKSAVLVHKVPLLPRNLLLEVLKAPATKSSVPVRKVLLLPRNLLLEMLKVLRAPRNLRIQIRRFAMAGAALCERYKLIFFLIGYRSFLFDIYIYFSFLFDSPATHDLMGNDRRTGRFARRCSVAMGFDLGQSREARGDERGERRRGFGCQKTRTHVQ